MERVLENRYLVILKRVAYFLLVLSLSVCTVLNFIIWKEGRPEIIQLILNLLYSLRKFYSVPFLLIFELLSFVGKILSIKNGNSCDKKSLLYSSVFFIFAFLTLFFTRNTKLLYFLMMVYFAKDFEYKKILDVHISGKLFVLLVLIIGNVFALVAIPTDQRGNGFGMIHYNTLSQYLMFLLFALACRFNIHNERKVLFSILTIVLSILCIYPIYSRTPVVILVVFLVLLWADKLYAKMGVRIKKIINTTFNWLPIIMLVFSIILGILIVDYGLRLETSLDIRFIEFVYGIRDYGLSLFPWDIRFGETYIVSSPFYFDNHFIRLLFVYGLVFASITYFAFIYMNTRITKSNVYILIITFICIYICALTCDIFENELIITLMACAFSKDIFSIANEKDDIN